MQYYQQILANLQNIAPEQAESLEEEVNIMIHKLKFLPAENFPSVTVLRQNDDFATDIHESLNDKIRIAGGLAATDKGDSQVIILRKEDDSLYSVLPELLGNEWLRNTAAYRDNRIYIIELDDFGSDRHFLRDTEILAEILQPKYFYFGHEGDAWTKFDLVHS